MSESVPAATASPLSDTADARVVLSRIVKKTAVARRSKNDTGNPRADHTSLITCVVGGTVFEDCPSQVASIPAGPRVPTVDPHPSRIHDGYTKTPAADDRIAHTDTAAAVSGGHR